MSGVVGESGVRADLRRQVWEEISDAEEREFRERAEKLEARDTHPQFERARAAGARNLAEFFELFEDILVAAKNEDGLEYDIRFVNEFPQEDARLPCIYVEVISSEPYSGNGKVRKEYTPRFMERIEDPDSPGGVVEVFLRRKENVIRLNVCTKTGRERERLSEWIEEKFYQYIWGIRWGGCPHPVIFEGRGKDSTEDVRRNKIYCAPMDFYVVTAEIVWRRETILRHIAENIGVRVSPSNTSGLE